MFVTLIVDIITVLHWYCGYADCRFCTILFGILCIVTELFTRTTAVIGSTLLTYYQIVIIAQCSALFSRMPYIVNKAIIVSVTSVVDYLVNTTLNRQCLIGAVWPAGTGKFVMVGKAAGFWDFRKFFFKLPPTSSRGWLIQCGHVSRKDESGWIKYADIIKWRMLIIEADQK